MNSASYDLRSHGQKRVRTLNLTNLPSIIKSRLVYSKGQTALFIIVFAIICLHIPDYSTTEVWPTVSKDYIRHQHLLLSY